MLSIFENNLWLFWGGLILSIISWVCCAWIKSDTLRKRLRASIFFLGFPLVFFTHPFLYYQVWMLFIASIFDLNFIALSVMLVVWGILLLVSPYIGRHNDFADT
ncbi:hypothetical protein [Pleionea sediminis]|uniref:hypothetical protein n=1 Tax=Pleionea sediminis TaxID=2569479 RepID=UPI001186C1A6|nr:hypothetical protein [Pleionea sediminis]